MFIKRQKAQSVIEYVLLVAAIIAVLVVFLNPTGPFKRAIENQLNTAIVDRLNDMATEGVNW